ncbi:putative aquaporin 4 [Lentinula detonsa]|uniref:Aquaporin 4 n=1 Tax=Lentinula detonsa TaxID=2804962 RepID=A0AA38PN13_9AGAR|nr:putative aquaporin 4 [Lentinula detonsa]
MPPSSISSDPSSPNSPSDKKHFEPDELPMTATSVSTGRFVHPNWWWKYRQIIREIAAEFTGVMILIIFGTGVVSQVVLSSNPAVAPTPKGEYLSISFGWAAGNIFGRLRFCLLTTPLKGTALGVWVCLGISGGHINPAITIAFATWRGFPWKKVPGYIFGQLMGGVVGAALVYADYFHAIDIYEGGRGVRTLKTASLFSTYALDYMTNVSCFFSEFFATAILVIVILATTDKGNGPPPLGLLPLVLFILILGLGACLGMETGYAVNPARDLGPRLLTSMVGYGSAVYTFRNQYWLWCPVLAPILGAQAGAMFYDVFLFNGRESIVNKPNAKARRMIAAGDELV